MNKNLISIQSYIDAASVFHWAYMSHYVRWLTGEERNRHQRTEKVLKRLVRSGKLRSHLYGKKLIYIQGKKVRKLGELATVVHGLACTECLVRFYRSKPQGVTVPERYFRGLGSVPEWGIIYPNGSMLLLEFCTKSNFFYTGNMRGKLDAYDKNLAKIEEKFNCKAIVVFVLDVPRETVERYAGSFSRGAGSVADSEPSAPYGGDTFPSDPFFFTDYETFLKVPFGSQLKEPIYFWMDGNSYPLEKNV